MGWAAGLKPVANNLNPQSPQTTVCCYFGAAALVGYILDQEDRIFQTGALKTK